MLLAESVQQIVLQVDMAAALASCWDDDGLGSNKSMCKLNLRQCVWEPNLSGCECCLCVWFRIFACVPAGSVWFMPGSGLVASVLLDICR